MPPYERSYDSTKFSPSYSHIFVLISRIQKLLLAYIGYFFFFSGYWQLGKGKRDYMNPGSRSCYSEDDNKLS